MCTVGNTGRKAGALNQALAQIEAENVLVLDADTSIAPTFVEEGLALLDARPALGAVGGVFRGTEPTSVLEQLQHNEYERYAVQIDVTGRTAVLTGTAALVRTEALAAVARARGGTLPGPPGGGLRPGGDHRGLGADARAAHARVRARLAAEHVVHHGAHADAP